MAGVFVLHKVHLVNIFRFSVEWQLAVASIQRRVVHVIREGAGKHSNTCARQYIVEVVPAHELLLPKGLIQVLQLQHCAKSAPNI